MCSAPTHIPNHQNSTHHRRIMSNTLSTIYNSIKKLNKIYHQFHYNKLKSENYMSYEKWQNNCLIIQNVAKDHQCNILELPRAVNTVNAANIKRTLHTFIQ